MAACRIFGVVMVASALSLAGCSRTAQDYASEIDRGAEQEMVLKTLRDVDPAFYAQIRDRAAQRLAAGDPQTEVHASIQQEVRAYGLRQASHVASAPGDVVIQIMQAEKAVIEHLQQTDVDTCASFAMSGLPIGFRPDALEKPLIDQAATLRLVAGQAGRLAPVTRADPSAADFEAIYQTMLASGLDAAGAQHFFDGSLPSAAPREQCDTTTAFYAAILAQPPERAETVSAFVIKATAEHLAATGG